MREEGYYFVKIEGKWEIAKFYTFLASVTTNNHEFWNSIGLDRFRTDLDFDEIGGKIELPKDLIMIKQEILFDEYEGESDSINETSASDDDCF